MTKKIWSLFLTVCMVSTLFGSIPVTVNAEINSTDNNLMILKENFSVLNDSLEESEDSSSTITSDDLQNVDVFAGGDGTAENPYQVATPEQLNEVRNYLSSHFIQVCDIDMTDATSENGLYYNLGTGWIPVGDDTVPFTGTYDGDDYKIIGLKSNQISTNEELGGLFGYNSGVICNLGMVDGSIICNGYVGSIAGHNSGDIENCYNTGSIASSPAGDCHTSYVGGIVGLNEGNVKNCYNTGEIISSVSPSSEHSSMMPTIYAYAGGIVGMNDDNSVVENCYNTGTIMSFGSFSYKPSVSTFQPYITSETGGIVGHGASADNSIKYCCNMGVVSAKSNSIIPGGSSYVRNSRSYAGGIAGSYFTTIENCYNTGEITAETDKGSSVANIYYGDSYAGGITGWTKYITMKDCYNTGKVTASVLKADSSDSTYAGGISGIIPSRSTVQNCYNIGPVVALSDIGHIHVSGITADEGSATVTNCYYYDDSNLTEIVGTPLTLEELKQQDRYAGFDFETVWDISLNVNDGFPHLRNMPPIIEQSPVPPGDVNGDNTVNFQDAQLVLQHEAGLVTLSEEQLEVADVNGDGTINFQDAQLILQYEAGLIDSFERV